MEEAEALATNVAIMGTKMLATGTLASLQESHGGAYSVRAVRVPELSSAEVESIVKERFGGMVKGYTDAHRQVGWQLPHDKRALGSIMRVMEELMGDVIVEDDEDEDEAGQGQGTGAGGAAAGGSSTVVASRKVIQAYTVTGPTLEEVFMNVAREAGQAGGV